MIFFIADITFTLLIIEWIFFHFNKIVNISFTNELLCRGRND